MVPELEITFKISGSALSFLHYECDKSRTDQIGFLIGEKHSYIKKTISDSQMNGEKNETIINIVAVMPVSTPFLFSNNIGRIDRNKLKLLLGSLEKDICGWYVYRRNSGLNPLLRGTILHRELLEALPHVSPQSFVLCSIGSDVNHSRSTHRFRHVFFLHKNRIFEPISVPVINLGQPEDIGYRTVAVSTSSNTSINDIASSIRLDSNLGGLAALKALQKPLQEKIMEIAGEVLQFDKKTQQLMSEIQELKYNNFMIKCQDNTVTGKKIKHGGYEGDNISNKHVKQEFDVKEEENEDKPEEEEDKHNEDGEEIIYSSQKTDNLNNDVKSKESSPVNSLKSSENSEKIVIDESNSPPSSQTYRMSEEY